MKTIPSLHYQAVRLAENFRKSEAELLAVLQEIDTQKIYLIMGYSSLFKYAVEALNLSEAQSYAFMAVARKSKEVPELKNEIDAGTLTVSKAKRILPVLQKENQAEWIEKAKTLSKNDLEKEVAKVSPHAFQIKESIRAVAENRMSLRLELSDDIILKLRRAQTVIINKKRKNLNLEESLGYLLEDFLNRHDSLRRAQATFEKEKSKFGILNTVC